MPLDVQKTSMKNVSNWSRDYELSMELLTLCVRFSHICENKSDPIWNLTALVLQLSYEPELPSENWQNANGVERVKII